MRFSEDGAHDAADLVVCDGGPVLLVPGAVMVRDDFNPRIYTVAQQRAPLSEYLVTELIRDALKSSKPSMLGALTNPDTGEALYPNLARRNAALKPRVRVKMGRL